MTELVAGVDIVREQFLVAAGLPLGDDVVAAGERASRPVGPRDRGAHHRRGSVAGVRADAGSRRAVGDARRARASASTPRSSPATACRRTTTTSSRSCIVHGPDRDAAIDRLRRALDETEIGGVQTTLPFHRFVASSEAFRAADLSTGWVDAALGWRGRAPRGGREGAARRRARRRGRRCLRWRRDPDAAPVDAATHPSRDASDDARAATPMTGDGWRRDGRARMVDRWPG